jgi:hypothetical protein
LLFVLPGHRRPPPVSDTFGVDEAVLGSHWNDALTFEAAYIEIVLTLCGASELFKNCQVFAADIDPVGAALISHMKGIVPKVRLEL